MAKKEFIQNHAQPKMMLRNQQVIYHHLFKADLKNMLKNLAFGGAPAKLEEIPHVHHFHSINSMGHQQKYTTMVGGHCHAVTWEIDAQGNYLAKCGPALKKVVRASARGNKTTYEPIMFKAESADGHFVNIKDDHVHEMEYRGSDELSVANIQAIQQKNAQMLSAMAPRPTAEASISDSDRGE